MEIFNRNEIGTGFLDRYLSDKADGDFERSHDTKHGLRILVKEKECVTIDLYNCREREKRTVQADLSELFVRPAS